MANAINLGRNPTLIESLSQGFGLAAPGLVQGAQQRQQQQGLEQQQGLQQQDLASLLAFNQQQQLFQQASQPGNAAAVGNVLGNIGQFGQSAGGTLPQGTLPPSGLGQLQAPQAPQFPTFQSQQFQGLQAQQLFAGQDPKRQAEINALNAQAEKNRRPKVAKPISPTSQIAQKRLDIINALEEKERQGKITPAEKQLLNKAILPSGINIDFSKGQLLQTANSLRKEFNTDQRVKDFRIIAPKFKNMLSFFDRSRVTGQKGPTDIALSKTFQKLTDLMSSVREGEYETTFRGQALLQKLRGGILKLSQGGEGITPEFRQELVDTARLMFDDGKLFFNQALEEKGSIADAFNIPRAQVLGNMKPFNVTNTNTEFEELFGATTQQGGAQQGGQSLIVDNPKTGETLQSFDGGQTWQPIQ